MIRRDFSAELQCALELSIEAHVASGGTDHARLFTAAERVCAEAHAAGMRPEEMVIAVRGAYDRGTIHDPRSEDVRRQAYDRLLLQCIRTYFAASAKPAPEA